MSVNYKVLEKEIELTVPTEDAVAMIALASNRASNNDTDYGDELKRTYDRYKETGKIS